jgi:hypothetical protein
MHLTYQIDEKELYRGNRQKLITNALSTFSVTDREGELVLTIPKEQYGDALYSFVQALLKINDADYLTRERVKSTFLEDFRAFITEEVPEDRRVFDWSDKQHDPEGRYVVDCRVNGMAKPLMIYALPSDDKARDATIGLLKFEVWGLSCRGLRISKTLTASISNGKALPFLLNEPERLGAARTEFLSNSHQPTRPKPLSGIERNAIAISSAARELPATPWHGRAWRFAMRDLGPEFGIGGREWIEKHIADSLADDEKMFLKSGS